MAPTPRVDLPPPTLGRPEAAPSAERYVVEGDQPCALWVFNFGLACCAVEVVAASMRSAEVTRPPSGPISQGEVQVMVVAGTVTDKVAPAVQRVYAQMPEPKYVLSFGSCANSGGPYWDSYSVTKGVDQIVPVDVYVPGCPPRPEALLDGIRLLREKLASRS